VDIGVELATDRGPYSVEAGKEGLWILVLSWPLIEACTVLRRARRGGEYWC